MAFADTIKGIVIGGLPAIAIGVGVLLFVVGAIVISVVVYKRKKWNLKGDAILLRNNLADQYEDYVKGYWDASSGWIVLKRRGYRKVHTRPFDPKKWLVGRNKFHVIQTGPEDYVIARFDCRIVRDEETGKDMAIMDVVADLGKRKTWKNYTERMGKKTFTLRGWAEQHQMAITLAIVIFVIFLGFAILWMRMPDICKTALIPLAITGGLKPSRKG